MNSPNRGEKKAMQLLADMGVGGLPVPVEKVARHLGAKLTYDAYEGDVSGMLYRAADQTLIGVNSRHAQTRQRFTIAHEIGHLVMHPGTPMFVDRFARVNWRNGASNKEEAEANSFAAELLMPRRFVEAEVERVVSKRPNPTPDQLAAILAGRFDVSAEAMRYRLSNLGVLDPTP